MTQGARIEAPGSDVVDSVRRFHARALGSSLHLTVVGAGETPAAAAWQDTVEVFEAVDREMSGHRPDSQVGQLNGRCHEWVDGLRPSLYAAVALTERARRRTGGRFDPRILADLARLGSVGAGTASAGSPDPGGRRPSGAVLERCPRARSVRLSAPIDLGGIGKGLALRWALARAQARLSGGEDDGGDRPIGLLLDAGGDLVVSGPAPNGAWMIAVEDPSGAPEPMAVIKVARGAVATSSVRIQQWRSPAGELVHHLIDPATGFSARTGLQSVTVWWPDPAWAEVWTKALFIAGARSLADAANDLGLAAWWIDDDGRLGRSRRADPMTVWP